MIQFSKCRLIIQDRRVLVPILNDTMVSIWYIAGSICFFYPVNKETGVLLFLLGSIQLFTRNLIRIMKSIQIKLVSGYRNNSRNPQKSGQ
ncbi:YrhK family protein [Paenibacillus tarimensis]|uniref:YrhK family protein n=1 Tax=Paenibacillus tarimensis TaxID=416012 RepID=UPI001F2FD737|nr:YrhK family protein [Paenibacillus tarimensis]MCF2945535.1 YrhK family protein [Paenibacillus tarimensis]